MCENHVAAAAQVRRCAAFTKEITFSLDDSSSFCHQQQQEGHDQMVSSLTAQLRDTRQELREKEKEKKEVDRFWRNYRDDRETEERRLRDSLQRRDKLIEVKRRNQPTVLSTRGQRTAI